MANRLNNLRIYLKDSDKVRLADTRIRIVRESDPLEPCDNEDLVFEKAEDESYIPKNALFYSTFSQDQFIYRILYIILINSDTARRITLRIHIDDQNFFSFFS